MSFTPRIRSTTAGAFHLAAGAEPSPGYRLTRLRGRGGFAEVWEATSPDGGPPVALKFMLSSNTSTTARELRSIQSFQGLDHPHLVRNHAVWLVPGYVVIAMELAEATLLDLMLVYHNDLGQHLDVPQLGKHLWQVADALDFLNARQHLRDGRKVGFQHGDIKPNNVLLCGDVAKLTDYGLATATQGPSTPCPRHGTLEYAAPEVFQGSLSDTSDQFSLAVTYCVLRTGGFPFPPTPVEDLRKSFHRPPPMLDNLPPGERAALLRALAPVPQDRFPSCRDFLRAILKANGLRVAWADDRHQIVPDDETVNDPPLSALRPRSGVLRVSSVQRSSPSGLAAGTPLPPSPSPSPSGRGKTPSNFSPPSGFRKP